MKFNIPQLIDQAEVYQAAIKTPLDYARLLSTKTKNCLYLKREDLQPVFSFKIRGAFNRINQLSDAQKEAGVVAASAGNHAQGVAYSAKQLGIPATIVMPETTPQIKVNAVRDYGADVILHGESYSDAADHAKKLVAQSGLSYIHPFDDPYVIAGQGTIAKEILEQLDKPPEYIFICIGGGGLAAGVASYIKTKSTSTKVIGVQANDSDAMAQSIKHGQRVYLNDVGIFSDGTAVKQVGELTFELCRELLDEIILVSTDEICAAIKDAFEDTRSVLEPAGALGIAGAKKYLVKEGIEHKNVVAIASGANMNFDRLRHVSERTEFAERREAIIAVTIPEAAGSFKAFCQVIGKRNVTEFNYRYTASAHKHDNTTNQAHVYVGVQIKSAQELLELIKQLNENGYATVDLTDNEMAKLHIRHLVGGHAGRTIDEKLYRFQFPERPGALMHFLDQLGKNWNISLFHYRNHGADFGRVLCGLQIPSDEDSDFEQFLEQLGYPYFDESDNPAYALFLA